MSLNNKVISIVGALIIAVCAAQAAEAFPVTNEKEVARQATQGVVNINTATAAQLSLLPGVGPSRADAIIAARGRRPFRTVNELARVRGIGRATLNRLRPYVTVNGETTLSRRVPMPSRER